jgi:hypothetical protein
MNRGVPVVVGLLCCLCARSATPALGQDLFELEVFEYESSAPGEYEVEFHSNGMTRGAVSGESREANHRPVHVSAEVTRGWTNKLETALFLQAAPFGSPGSVRFAGGHARAKYQFGELGPLPLRLAASAEYAFNRAVLDHELQTFELRGIVDLELGRLWLVANPSVEVVTRGAEASLEPVFDVSARAAWKLSRRLTAVSDYFSAAATTRHLLPQPDAHHLLFMGADLEVAPGWELALSVGHCLTRSGEPWLMKSIIGFRF